MSYITSEAKAAWKEISQALLDSDGGLGIKCVLLFQNTIVASPTIGFSDIVSDKPRFMPNYGGLSTPNAMPGYEESSFTDASGFYQAESSKTIYGKVYGANKDFDNSIFAQSSENIWKLVCDKKYIPDIMRCSYSNFYSGSVKEYKTKLIKPPISYGLGQDVNCISYWIDF